jgi:hypothetical protein
MKRPGIKRGPYEEKAPADGIGRFAAGCALAAILHEEARHEARALREPVLRPPYRVAYSLYGFGFFGCGWRWYLRNVMRVLVRYLCLGLLAGVLAGGAAASNAAGDSAAGGRAGLPFAIADFDGDSRPDLARVETGPGDFANSEYWIQLRFSSLEWESIRLVAPAGGLRISARDVNGDASVDLIVSTVWSNRPVAIYLNDGHGSFVRAEPSAFPRAFGDSAAVWSFDAGLAADGVVVPSSQDHVICPEAQEYSYARIPSRLIGFTNAVYRLGPPLFLHAGRAPPSQTISL